MYDYVRRQQEVHPQLFSSKTFRWVDSGLQETSWVKVYDGRTSGEPLASALSASQHTSASATMANRPLHRTQSTHRKLFSLGRTRNHSDATTSSSAVFSTPTSPPGRPSRSTIGSPEFVRTAKRRRRGYTQSTAEAPMRSAQESSMPAASISQRQTHLQPSARASQNSMLGPGIFIDGSSSLYQSSTSLSSAPLHLSSQQQQPSLLPPPRRTICYHARSLLHKVRKMKTARPHPHPQSFSVIGSRAVASVSRANDDEALGKIIQREHARRRLAPRDSLSVRQHRVHMAGRTSASTTAKSPLSRALSIADDDDDDNTSAEEKPGTQNTQPARKAMATSDVSDSTSDDEDVVMCLVCTRHEGADWTVHCAATHALCFSCVQSHVKHVLQTATTAISCPVKGCTAELPHAALRKCLPPQRLEQLLAASTATKESVHGTKESVRSIIRRSLSRSRKRNSTESQSSSQTNQPGSATDDAEQFDVPIIRVETRASQDQSAIAPPTTRLSTLHEEDAAMLSVPPSPSGNSTTGDFDELQKSLGNMSLVTDGDEQAPALLSEFTQIQPIEGASLSDSGQTLSPEPDPRLRRVPKAHHNMRADDSSPRVVNEPTSALFEYADMQLDTYTPSPNLATTAAGSLAPSSSPLSLPLPRLPRPLSFIPTNPVVPPPVPPSLPFEFRASATWITPEQRYSGFAENLMLNAALFDTIRRESNPSSEEETEVNTKRPEKRPAPCNDVLVPAKDDEGVYIPTWRRKEPGKQPTVPLWADPDYSSDAAILSEAAELTFELYESLHSLR